DFVRSPVFRSELRTAPADVAPPAADAGALTTTVYVWGSGRHLAPENFAFPEGSAVVAWQQYMCGNAAKGYPPLRVLRPSDMATTNLRKRLSDFRFLMPCLEDRVRAEGQWLENPTLAEAAAMFAVGCQAITVADSTPAERKRRLEQIHWSTHV